MGRNGSGMSSRAMPELSLSGKELWRTEVVLESPDKARS